MNSEKFKYFFAAISGTAIWGTFSIPIRNLKQYSSNEIFIYRLFCSLIITWLVILLFRKNKIYTDFNYLKSLEQKSRIKLLSFLLLSGIFISINWISFLYTVNHVSLKSAAFAYMVCPLITAMGGFIILKEQLSTLKLIAIAIAMISVFILAQGSLVEVLWSILVATTYTFYVLLQRVILKLDKLNVLGVQLILATIMILPVSGYFLGGHLPPTESYFWVNIFIIAVLFTIIPLLLVSYALISMPSSTMGIIIYINPIVAFAVAFLYFGETISLDQFYAYSLLLLSVVVFNWEVLRLFVINKKNKVNTI